MVKDLSNKYTENKIISRKKFIDGENEYYIDLTLYRKVDTGMNVSHQYPNIYLFTVYTKTNGLLPYNKVLEYSESWNCMMDDHEVIHECFRMTEKLNNAYDFDIEGWKVFRSDGCIHLDEIE